MASDTRMRRETEAAAMVESAAYLGAHRVDVNGNDPDAARLTTSRGPVRLCAEHGSGSGSVHDVHPIRPWVTHCAESSVRGGNATVTVDALHLARSGLAAGRRELDSAQISYVQLYDGPLSRLGRDTPAARSTLRRGRPGVCSGRPRRGGAPSTVYAAQQTRPDR